MKKHLLPPSRFALLFTLAAVTAGAALTPSEWQHRQSLKVAALVLTKAEIRDLVEALSSLTEPVMPQEKKPLRALQHLAGD